MTRYEQRAKCIEAIKRAYIAAYGLGGVDAAFAAAFDSLHGIARVVPIEATEDMQHSGSIMIDGTWSEARMCYEEMTAIGVITNPPEGKP
jgi:hypothetical protein